MIRGIFHNLFPNFHIVDQLYSCSGKPTWENGAIAPKVFKIFFYPFKNVFYGQSLATKLVVVLDYNHTQYLFIGGGF